MERHETLQTPVLLVAMPQVMDPFFHQSVVLLVHHDGEGSVGFILNRPTEVHIPDILRGMELQWTGRKDAVAHFGGPVQPQLGSVLFGNLAADEPQPEGSTELSEGVGITQHVGDLARLAVAPPQDFLLLLGYAGWGAGQLMEEIVRNDWITAPAQPRLIFASDVAETWGEALRAVGVDPASLPAWSPAMDEGEAN